MDGETDGWMDGWMKRQMDGWMDGWRDGRTDGRTDIDRQTLFSIFAGSSLKHLSVRFLELYK